MRTYKPFRPTETPRPNGFPLIQLRNDRKSIRRGPIKLYTAYLTNYPAGEESGRPFVLTKPIWLIGPPPHAQLTPHTLANKARRSSCHSTGSYEELIEISAERNPRHTSSSRSGRLVSGCGTLDALLAEERSVSRAGLGSNSLKAHQIP